MIKNRNEWLSSIREVSLLPDPPVVQKNGIWEVVQRKEMWEAVGPSIFDGHLDQFRKVAVEVLRELDPQFELEAGQRFAANVYEKTLKYSRELREGLSETLALLGSFPAALTSCSHGKAAGTALLAVREILADADSILWCSLNDHLPMLAEAAPNEFLSAVENATMATPCPIEEMYAQESGGIMGRNYITGLLWALETIAWHPDHLTRVIVLLGDLSELDPGGQSANRPLNSARDILLPWHPQTSADISRRKAAVTALLRDHPGAGWQLLLGLLPESNVITTGTRKPKWQDFLGPEFSEKVTIQAYWEQIGVYAEFAVDEAASDPGKLPTLIGRLPDLPEQAQTRLLGILGSDEVSTMAGFDQRPIWEALVSLAAQHRKYPDADWAMTPETIARIDEVASKLAPASPSLLHRRLFSDNNFDLFEENGEYHDQQRILTAKREAAVRDIIADSGLPGVLAFAESVDSPVQVGLILGLMADNFADGELLPAYLINNSKKLARLSVGFLLGRFRAKGSEWVDKTDTQNWTLAQKGAFFSSLPFTRETWLRQNESLEPIPQHIGRRRTPIRTRQRKKTSRSLQSSC